MQYSLVDLLKPEHVLVDLCASSSQQAIRKLTRPLVRSGHVAPAFATDVWEREQKFPTGLPTQPMATAMPHADPDHVNRSAVAIAVLRSPVRFGQMGTDGSVVLDARIIFLLAIKEREKQVEMIQQLVSVIQNQSLLESLVAARDAQGVVDLIRTAPKA